VTHIVIALGFASQTQELELYRIYYFPIRPEPEPDFQTDCNFTNLMCKNIMKVQVI